MSEHFRTHKIETIIRNFTSILQRSSGVILLLRRRLICWCIAPLLTLGNRTSSKISNKKRKVSERKQGRNPQTVDGISPRPLFHALDLCLRRLNPEIVNSASLNRNPPNKKKGNCCAEMVTSPQKTAAK